MTVERASVDAADGSDRLSLFENSPRVVRLSLPAGERVPPHTHPDAVILFQVLAGTVELDLGDQTHRAEAGEILRFDGDQEISPRAVSDAEALVILADR
jgi:quercetin dioxygenase-like cupin family protein